MVKKREVKVGDDDDKVASMSDLFIPKVAWIFPIKGESVFNTQ